MSNHSPPPLVLLQSQIHARMIQNIIFRSRLRMRSSLVILPVLSVSYFECMIYNSSGVLGETLRSTELLREAEVSRDRATGLLNLLQSLKQVINQSQLGLFLSTRLTR